MAYIRVKTSKHPHDDAPDTSVQFRRLAGMPEGPEKQALDSYATLSLDAALTDTGDGYSLADTVASTEPGFDQAVDREAARPHLSRLPEREREILYLRFFCDMTQSSIARRMGISQMHVSRLISRTCAHIGERVQADRAAAA